ncbi:O-antigen ligase family protein [Rhodococcus opacus]|uniref:O-antigen ligase-related domain-containing protein n=1 Tax=Rhodococcus opacus TaxID=37919 RepID=A0A1B1K2C6_RHOOP|nr:O-antigen ligase family protein [Rhodococcus opacus]ANS26718.1 hypothetical protein R1CP_10010 [Rhodococcus opacus]UNN03154.1 O-antigen ligase family protein [Rhodococcus opacus]
MSVALDRIVSGDGPVLDRLWRRWLSPAVLLAGVLVVLGLVARSPSGFGTVMLFGGFGFAMIYAGLRNPVVAAFFLLLTIFLRLALPPIFPVDPFMLAFAGMIGSVAIGVARRRCRVPQVGALEGVMVLYVLWNIASMITSHKYLATVPTTGEELAVPRFLMTGTVIPFALYFVGRFVFDRESAVRRLLWMILGLGAYSAAVSIMQLRGPVALVWPSYIVETPAWEGRAVGIFNQPVVNGLVLIIGFIVAMVLAGERSEPLWRRVLAVAIALASAYGVYLTHTRAVWLAFAIVLVGGALYARGFRSGFVSGIAVSVLAVATNWSTFTSADRQAGGVGSEGELLDRLNTLATSVWAIREEPLLGWGVGRFTALNTYHHTQWSSDVPWVRGFGIASHLNELGIVAELGLIGLVLWLAVLVLVCVKLIRAYRALPAEGLCGRRLGFVAIMTFLVLVVTGLTVDLRFFDFPNAIVMLLAGVAIGFADRLPNGQEQESAGVSAGRVER